MRELGQITGFEAMVFHTVSWGLGVKMSSEQRGPWPFTPICFHSGIHSYTSFIDLESKHICKEELTDFLWKSIKLLDLIILRLDTSMILFYDVC